MTTISLAFSGSGFKVPAHIGALSCLLKENLKIVEVAGTSGGSIVASFFASGKTIEELTSMSLSYSWKNLLRFSLYSAIRYGSYCDGSSLFEFLKKELYGIKFSDLEVGLKVVATDLITKEPVIFSQETTPDVYVSFAVRASCSIPLVYAPVEYEDKLLVDGSILNNIPVDTLNHSSDIKLGVNLISNKKRTNKDKELHKPWVLVKELVSTMVGSNENMHIHDAVKRGAKIAYVETGFANSLDLEMSMDIRKKLMSSGYDTMSSLLKNTAIPC